MPNDDDKANFSIVELVQAQVRPLGINVVIKTMDRATPRKVRRSYDFDLDGGFGLGGLHDDSDSLYFARFLSTSRGNYSVIKDPQLDRMLFASRAEANLEKRRELLRSISKYVAEKMYYIELIYRPQWGFWQPNVKNFKPHFGSQAPYAFAWVDR